MRNTFTKIAPVALLLAGGTAALAQNNASMTGTVTDATGAAVAGAQIVLSNPSIGLRYTQKTDGKGSYRFTNVQPVNGYVETVTAPGFSTSQVKDITLDVAQTRTQDVKLLAGANTAIEVSAGSSEVTINTTDATIGNTIDVKQLGDLPVQDRTSGITNLFLLQPGVEPGNDTVAGARYDQSSVTLDGLDVNDIATGQAFHITATAPVDAVSQFTGTIAGMNANLGTGSGGQFQLVTKNGTNQFHGDINEYHRDTATAANTWFLNNTGLPRTPLIRNQFGGNVGGPIKRDKLFFFFDYAGSRIVQSSSTTRTVPLDSYRAGTMSYINNGAGCGASSRSNTTPTCISTLTQAQLAALDPGGLGFDQNVLSYIASRPYPHANDLTLGDGVNTGGYRFTTPTPVNDDTYVGRIDYNLTPKQKIYGRFTLNRQNSIESLQEFGSDPVTHPYQDRSYAYVVSHEWQIGSNKVNQFYYGDTVEKYNFPDVYNPTGANQYTFAGFDGPYTGFDGQQRRVPIPVVRDDFNWQIKSHSIAFGGLFKFIKTHSNLITDFNNVSIGGGGFLANELSAGSSARPANINASATAQTTDYDPLFLSGLGVIGDISTYYNYNNVGAALPAGSGGSRAYRYYQWEAYVGDVWKATSKLTLDYGVRYQFYTVPYEANGNESVEVLLNGTGQQQAPSLTNVINTRLAQSAAGNTAVNGLPYYSVVLGGKVNNGPALYQPSYKDFAPRVALAYAATPKTVINAGAGIVYDRSVINAINFLQDQISYLFDNTTENDFPLAGAATPEAAVAGAPRVGASLAYSASLNPAPQTITSPLTPYVDSTGTPYGLAAGQTNFVISPTLKDPYSIALNAGVQQELPGHMVLKLNYAGRLGRRLLADGDAGQVLDFPDKVSGQNMSQAFANMTTQLRAGQTPTAQPWFEDVLAPGTGKALGYASNTALVNRLAGTYVQRGDISDALYELAVYTYYGGLTGFLPYNVGVPSQFGSNAYLTNQGNSNYHALLVTLQKNLSQGLRFDANYTWSHAIDNSSLSSNNNALFSNSGFICDVVHPRACRGNADFDVTSVFNSDVTYELPFGHNKMFAANDPQWLDEVIGGWAVSGLPAYRSGQTVNPYSDAYLASFDNQDPAIFTGNKGDLRMSLNKSSSGTLYGFAGGATGAAKVLAEFRGPIGIEYGQRNIVRGPGAFTFDAGLAKTFPIIRDKVNFKFRADAFNAFNHPVFGSPNINIVNNASQFGQITGTTGQSNYTYRVAQFSGRIEF